MESWVDIKKENQIMRVPYQAFKDRFEHDGFSLVIDESLNESPTFSILEEDKDKNSQTTEKTVRTLEQKTQGGQKNGCKQRSGNKCSSRK